MVQCQAKSKRSQKQCMNQAIRGMKVCRMHGGTLGRKKAQRARKIAPLKHGFYTKEAITERKQTKELLSNIQTQF